MFPTVCQIALKEWAVVVSALGRGEQVLLLRKGGVREEGRDFKVMYPEFLLYPTLEHQQEELLAERYQQDLRNLLSQVQNGDSITFTHWAKVEEVIEISEQEKVNALSPHYIWTRDYAEKRLRWKPKHQLSVMLLRLYRLEEPKRVPYLPAYGGCKSWVNLSQDVLLGQLTPILTEGEFLAKVGEVKKALGT